MCVRPLNVRVVSRTFGTARWIQAPCGKCNECLRHRQNSWKLRISEEAKNWVNAYFFTLTYRNETLPYNLNPLTGELLSSARKCQVQSWLKRMRERICREENLVSREERNFMKYFICAEYGPKPTGTKRPHYHGVILTSLDYGSFVASFNEWRTLYGRVEFKKVKVLKKRYSNDTLEAARSRVANYISKYCAKGQFESRKHDIEDGLIERAWFISSKNIGYSYVEKNKAFFHSFVPDVIGINGDWQEDEVYNLYKSHRESPIFKQVERLVDNCKVYNGLDAFGYKMPRYYRERLFLAHKTFINKTIDENNNIKEVKVKRYVSENFLSVAMSVVVRVRSEENDIKLIRSILGKPSNYTLRKIDSAVLELEALKEASRLCRESSITSKLSRFYSSNMFKNKVFDE